MSQLYALLSRVLEIDSHTITDQTAPQNTPSWDSFNGLMLVSELENQFNVKFTMDEVKAVQNVGDIKAALLRHGVDPDA